MTLRRFQKLIIDVVAWALAIPLAYFLRLDWKFVDHAASIGLLVLISLPIQAVLLWFFASHRQSWHKVSVSDLVRIGAMTTIWAGLLALIGYAARPAWLFVPRSVPVIADMAAFLFLTGSRAAFRIYFERNARQRYSSESKRILVVGAGEAGTMLVREMKRHPESGMISVGFLDDDRNKQKQTIAGLPVLGRIEELPAAVSAHAIDEVLIAMPSANGAKIRQVVELAQASRANFRIMPAIHDLLSGKVGISQLREVDVEDLLRRDPVKLDLSEIARYLEGRVVLITGAGGSIGSELVRQIARFNPRRLILVGRGENSIFQIQNELQRAWPKLEFEARITDVRDREKLRRIFEETRPEVVFHAAAHKHVPLMECNSDEAIKNNIGGTRNVAELALEFGIQRFVNISTDKAVNPTSVMGASKRVAEQILESTAKRAKANQSFVSVRFGNVLGSRGSVIPTFKEQIRKRETVTVTHPEMTRYFMTIPEAAQLVLQAGGMAQNGAVYVLDMGEPVKIVDLARDLIRLSGLTPGDDIDIQFTGLRPGEKLYEELLTAEEGSTATKHTKISVAKLQSLPEQAIFESRLSALLESAARGDANAIRAGLVAMVPTFRAPSHAPAPQPTQPAAKNA